MFNLDRMSIDTGNVEANIDTLALINKSHNSAIRRRRRKFGCAIILTVSKQQLGIIGRKVCT